MSLSRLGPNRNRIIRPERWLWVVTLMALAAGLAVVPVEAGEWASRLSLKAGSGCGILGWGDVEALRNSFHRQIRAAADAFSIVVTGTCKNPRLGWQAEVELHLELNPRLSLGLGLGRSSRSRETVLSADWPPFLTSEHSWSQGCAITQVALNAYWRFPLAVRSDAYVKAGAGIASAVWEYKIRDEETIDFVSWEQIEGTARDKGLFLQVGLGYEIRVAKRLTVFAEARGQILSLDDWRTDHIVSTDASSEKISGGLWLAEVTTSGGRPAKTLLLASEFGPAGWLYDNVRPVRLNFSGGIFLAGFRLGLGARPASRSLR